MTPAVRHPRLPCARSLWLPILFTTLLALTRPAGGADHGDAPMLANDRAADIGDVFVFLDPTDNTRVVIAVTVQGFIVPQEAVNFAFFDGHVALFPSVDYNTPPASSTYPEDKFSSGTIFWLGR